MAQRRILFAVSVSFFTLVTLIFSAQAPARGQSQGSLTPRQSFRPADKGVGYLTTAREKALAMTESMQVMGQILDDAVEDLFQPQLAQEIQPQWAQGTFRFYAGFAAGLKRSSPGNIKAPHVVYLDGYGVVYQLETPPLYQVIEVVEAQHPAPRKPLSVWEKTRRRLRGEKVEELDLLEYRLRTVTKQLASAPTKDQMVEKLLALLAENGHNFEHLADDDRLTVAITFRQAAASAGDKSKTSYLRAVKEILPSGGVKVSGTWPVPYSHVTQPAALPGPPAQDVPPPLDTRTGGLAFGKLTHELTGDLHLRQGDYKKAIEAYEKNLRQSFSTESLYGRIKFPPEGLSKQNRSLMQKLSQAQIGAGNFDKARKLLDNLSRAEAAAHQATRSNKRSNETSPSAAQLVVSVKKSDLDAVAAGKLPHETFKKQASVRYFDPTTVRRKPEVE